jgi:hypothetical protein
VGRDDSWDLADEREKHAAGEDGRRFLELWNRFYAGRANQPGGLVVFRVVLGAFFVIVVVSGLR